MVSAERHHSESAVAGRGGEMSGYQQTILIIDDAKENIDILLSLLDDYDLLVAKSGQKALELAKSENVDLILLDIVMPGMDGFEVCRRLKNIPETREIPILFITAKTDEESIEKAFKTGGSDYVTKPFKPKELLARVRMQLKLRETQKALKYAAERDSLTGYYNRRKFFEEGEALFDRSNGSLYAVMCDIDRFKRINDTYGHAFGDTIIRYISETIAKGTKTDAILGRLGGEEFAILCLDESFENVRERIELLRKAIEISDHPFEHKNVKVSLSCGIAKKEEGDTLDTLLNRADKALYDAKDAGRNRVRFRISDES